MPLRTTFYGLYWCFVLLSAQLVCMFLFLPQKATHTFIYEPIANNAQIFCASETAGQVELSCQSVNFAKEY